MHILLIDSYNMIHRARYGFGSGDHFVTFNFFRQLKCEIERHKPDIVYLVDEGRPVQSLSVDQNYKGNRVKDKDNSFLRQKSEIFQIAKTMLGVRYAQHPERECDDVIGHLAQVKHKDDQVTIISSDTDFIQLLDTSDRVKLWNPIKGIFVENHKFDYVTWKALLGDATDNVPGIPGVGPAKATKLLSSNEAWQSFFTTNPDAQGIFDRAYAMIKFKKVPDNEVLYLSAKFDDNALLQEFTNREFKSIIGKAWPKWQKAFGDLNV